MNVLTTSIVDIYPQKPGETDFSKLMTLELMPNDKPGEGHSFIYNVFKVRSVGPGYMGPYDGYHIKNDAEKLKIIEPSTVIHAYGNTVREDFARNIDALPRRLFVWYFDDHGEKSVVELIKNEDYKNYILHPHKDSTGPGFVYGFSGQLKRYREKFIVKLLRRKIVKGNVEAVRSILYGKKNLAQAKILTVDMVCGIKDTDIEKRRFGSEMIVLDDGDDFVFEPLRTSGYSCKRFTIQPFYDAFAARDKRNDGLLSEHRNVVKFRVIVDKSEENEEGAK